MKKIILILSLILLLLPTVFAANTVKIHDFYANGCQHCAKLDVFLEEQKQIYSLNVTRFEIHEQPQALMEAAKRYGLELGSTVYTPTVFINNKVIVGAKLDEIGKEIDYCSKNKCEDPATYSKGKTGTLSKLTIPAVITAAAVDAINPCEFAVLIILMTSILAAGSRRRALLAGLAFTLAIFISYYLMGLGIFSALHASGLTRVFYIAMSVLAIILGLFNLKDYFFYGEWFKMEVPDSWRPAMRKIIRGVTSIPGAFLVGIVVSLFLLPCTSGPYVVILGMLADTATRAAAMAYLVLYNAIFIIPMLGITLAIYFGFTTPEKAEEWRQKKLEKMHLIAGVLLLIIGAVMVLSLVMGWV